MHKYKIDNFLIEYPEQQFPSVRKLSEEECFFIKSTLMENFACDGNLDDLLKTFRQYENRRGNLDEEGISLIRKLLDENTKETSIFIDWHRFDDIDEIAVSDFLIYFDDIWYPAADDIDVFDKSCSWVMRVSHWSDIFLTHTIDKD